MAATIKSLSAIPSIKQTPLFNEQEWVIEVQRAIKEDIADEDVKTQVSIFCVPQALVLCKPEAYVPQLFALGPYHHWRPQLYDMERYKIAAARRIQGRLNGVEFDGVVTKFVKKEYKIRCHYHKHLDVNGETLAWMMALDASFLLEFLQEIYFKNQAKARQKAQLRILSKIMEHERAKIGFDMILRDITMLENQIPLFLIRKLFNLVYWQKDIEDGELRSMLIEFVKEVSPFKITDDSLKLTMDGNDITHHAHLLELLYWTIVPKVKEHANEINEGNEENDGAERKEEIRGDPTAIQKVWNWLWESLSRLNGGPIRCIKHLIFSRPVKLIVKAPWKIIMALPVFSLIKRPVKNFFSHLNPEPKINSSKKWDGEEEPPLVEEIEIPSVVELIREGVKFVTTSRDLTTIRFDTKTITMYLPVINLDDNTEVILRNLVAYEASAVRGPMIFTRYAELMFGIIDTEEDVKALRDKRILVNRTKSDREAAELWNGMSKSVRPSKVGFLDKAIEDVNKYYGSRWRVKCRMFMKKYVYASWPILTFLAAGLLIFLSCVQAFCSVYSCSSHLTQLINSGDQS